ncbi:MAG: hypothetical protein ACK5GJ_11215, partial [Planctomycetota bacterium]
MSSSCRLWNQRPHCANLVNLVNKVRRQCRQRRQWGQCCPTPHPTAVGGPMVDDFSEIIAGIRAIVIGLGGFATPPCGGGFFDLIDGEGPNRVSDLARSALTKLCTCVASGKRYPT